MKKMYDEDVAFKEYVDKYARDNGKTPKEALNDKLVQIIAKEYKNRKKGIVEP